MPGYDPNCPNCFKCMTCRGDGTVMQTRNVDPKNFKVITERVTCPTCNGVGGKPGAGSHNHR